MATFKPLNILKLSYIQWDIFTSANFCKTLIFALEENIILLGKSLL